MSLITGCPACGTMFRVVPDQLKISDGWVRCGHCQEVFDASANLRPEGALPQAAVEEEAPDAPAPSPTPAPEPEPPEPAIAPLLTRESPSAFTTAEPDHPDIELIEVENPYSEFPSSLHPVSEQPPQAEDAPAYPPSGFDTARAAPRSRPAPLDSVNSEVPDSVLRDADADDASDSELEEVGFVRQARRKAFWQRPLVRVLLLLLALALGALLTAQFAVQERDRLAAERPELRPWLERLCEPFGCRIGPPHRIEAIAIDTSAFTRLRQDTYRLSVTLKNHSAQTVAVPALQLTLTDTQDQPVLQRVLMPKDLGTAAPETLAPSAEWSASVALGVNPAAGGSRIAGYRLLAFYP